MKEFTIFGSAFMLTGVILGAFGAHALREALGDHGIEIWKTAVLYQFIHGLALIALAQNISQCTARRSRTILAFFAIGILLFSGSLYVLAICKINWVRAIMGPATPVGGLCFILGWLLTIQSLVKIKTK